MPDVTELLEQLADRPPCAPLPVDEVRSRARRRQERHRRRLTATAALGAAAAAIVAVASVSAFTGEEPEVRAGDPNRPPEAAEPTLTESRGGLTVSPASGLEDGDTITLSLDPDPGGEVVATQCAAEVLEFADLESGDIAGTPTEWCGSVFYLRSPAGRPDLTMTVRRSQRTPSGEIDCASAPGRCVVMEGSGLVGERFAPLVFADDVPQIVAPVLELVDVEGPIEDGQLVEVRGRDFALPAGEVLVMQCIGELGDAFNQGDAACDVARTAFLQLDPDGTFTARLRVFRDVMLPTPPTDGAGTGEGQTAPSWTACQPCVLVVGDARLPLDVIAARSGPPVRPDLRITSDGPYEPGERVGIEGDGFQVGQEVGISTCVDGSWDACGLPDEGFTTADGNGRFVIDDHPLPVEGTCASRPGACVLAWAPSTEGTPPAVTIPLDLSS